VPAISTPSSGAKVAQDVPLEALLGAIVKNMEAVEASALEDTQAAETEAKLYCVCRMPHVDGVLMVNCDMCSDWCVACLRVLERPWVSLSQQ
jgi:hypothetical protein